MGFRTALAVLAAGVFLFGSHTAQAGDAPAPSFLTWTPEQGEVGRFPSYDSFRDDLLQAVRQAQQRVLVLSLSLSDGDIATALFGATLRRKTVGVMLDPAGTRNWRSRFRYLVDSKVPVFMAGLSEKKMGGRTVLVIDERVFRISASLDEKTSGPVLFAASAWTVPEVVKWFSATPRIPSVARSQPPLRPVATPRPAKAPRRLPRETRLQRLLSGHTEATPPLEETILPNAQAPDDQRETELLGLPR